ncbi:MAG: hypothetical protein FWH33_08305 [Oscillospiraceae bacterium]|nr:hypothetical protein [Oscillospiraceae bacterium]
MSENNQWDDMMEKNQKQQLTRQRIEKGVKVAKNVRKVGNIVAAAFGIILIIILLVILATNS